MSRLEWNAFRNSGTRASPPQLHLTICPPTPSRYHVSSHAFTLRIVHQRFHVTICTLPDAFRCVQLALMFPHGRSLSAIFLYEDNHFPTQAPPHARGNVWERLAASGSLWEGLGASGSAGSVGENLGASENVWGASGNIWERMEAYGSVWAFQGSVGSVW